MVTVWVYTYGGIVGIAGLGHRSSEMPHQYRGGKKGFQLRPLMPIGCVKHAKERLLTHVDRIVRFSEQMPIVAVKSC